MSPRRSSASTSTPQIDKISIPGVMISELLEFQELFPDLRKNLAIIMLPVICIAQIRFSLLSFKATQIQGLESVNMYNTLLLGKSMPLTYVSSAVAIRRTSAAHAVDEDDQKILSDHLDLYTNLSGPLTTRGGLGAALGSKEKLRAYRRGIMSQVTGSLQSTSIHYPTRINKDILNVNPTNYLSALPFDTSDLSMDDIKLAVNSILAPNGNVRLITDYPAIPNGRVPMEEGILITRGVSEIPDVSKITNLDALPAWKRAAIKQAKGLTGGN